MIVGLKDRQISSITFGNESLSVMEIYVPDSWSLNDVRKNLLFKEGYSNSINDNNVEDKIELFQICEDNALTSRFKINNTRPDNSLELLNF